MWWQIGLWANAVVAIAYLLIVAAVLRPLVRDGQLRHNLLGAATAAIFLTCAVHHGGHVVHMLLPLGGVERDKGLALRASYDWAAGVWDVVTALVGVYYWTLRRAYAQMMRGAALFEDMRQRERAQHALDTSIEAASRMISDLLGPHASRASGGLLRSAAAVVSDQR